MYICMYTADHAAKLLNVHMYVTPSKKFNKFKGAEYLVVAHCIFQRKFIAMCYGRKRRFRFHKLYTFILNQHLQLTIYPCPSSATKLGDNILVKDPTAPLNRIPNLILMQNISFLVNTITFNSQMISKN